MSLITVMENDITYVIDGGLPSNNLLRQIVFILLVMYFVRYS